MTQPRFYLTPFLILLLCCSAHLVVYAQTPPPCDASTPQLGLVGPSVASVWLLPEEDPDHRGLEIRFQEGTDTITSVFPLLDNPVFLEEFFFEAPNTYEFTAIDTCEDGSTHMGGSLSLFIPVGDTVSFECPTPEGLNIGLLDFDNIQFNWFPSSQAIEYHATYSVDGITQASQDLSAPNFNFALSEDTPVHDFEIYNICDTTTFSAFPLLRSPSIKFSIVTVDDVKGLVCGENLDSLRSVRALRYLCSNHDNFGPNRDRFFNFHDTLCLTNILEIDPAKIFQVELRPNPVSDELQVQVHSHAPIEINVHITDLNGQLVAVPENSWRIEQEAYFQFQLDQLPTGVYLVHFSSTIGHFAKKIVLLP